MGSSGNFGEVPLRRRFVGLASSAPPCCQIAKELAKIDRVKARRISAPLLTVALRRGALWRATSFGQTSALNQNRRNLFSAERFFIRDALRGEMRDAQREAEGTLFHI